MQKITALLFNRLIITLLLILIQVALVIFVLFNLAHYFFVISFLLQLISFFLLLFILRDPGSASAKTTWAVLILVFPLVAIVLVFMIARRKKEGKKNLGIAEIPGYLEKYFPDTQEIKETLKQDPLSLSNMNYIESITHLPPRKNTKVTYFSLGEDFFESLKQAISEAEHYIFLEYFIIAEGKMWEELKTLLIQKAKEGLDVRLIYDDLGCMGMIPYRTNKNLEAEGVKVERFNPFNPILSIRHNTRDHRKITVIDGYIGYTGGVNIADEYINEKVKHGHWKDTAIGLVGDGVFELTLIFLETWQSYRPEEIDYETFKPNTYHKEAFENDGLVQCYGDSPLDAELLGQTVYLNILNQATSYVYIYTPYLIVDSEMMFGLASAAKRGIDVRIILPHHPDKWFVQLETQSSYAQLIKAGVKIYEYEPGFLHGKSFVSDDKVAVIGTINLDYRSLYHHLENGVLLYENKAVMDMKGDFLETQNKSILMDDATYSKLPLYKRFIGLFIKFLAPLM